MNCLGSQIAVKPQQLLNSHHQQRVGPLKVWPGAAAGLAYLQTVQHITGCDTSEPVYTGLQMQLWRKVTCHST